MRSVLRLSLTGFVVVNAFLGLTAGGSAQDAIAINGSVYIAGRPPMDPPPNVAKNTHAYLTIRGQGAVLMYRTMPAIAESDLCRGDGWKIKRAGDLACAISSNGKTAECDFAVELRRGMLAPGNPC